MGTPEIGYLDEYAANVEGEGMGDLSDLTSGPGFGHRTFVGLDIYQLSQE